MIRRSGLLLAALVLQACASAPDLAENESRSEFRSASMNYAPPPPLAGTVYNTAGSFDLFMDLRARAIGDILTVMLVERTNASKESSTSTAKGSSVDTGFPVIAGRPVTAGGTPIFNNEFESETTFDGQADSSQSNRLDGSITVTVARAAAERQLAGPRRKAHHDQSGRGVHPPRRDRSARRHRAGEHGALHEGG